MFAYFEISLLMTLAALLGMLANKLKQPPLLGYILAGVIINSLGIFGGETVEGLDLFSKIGITFLLFILGLELNIAELKKLGKTALITGLGQIVFTTIIGFGLSLLLGFDARVSTYISVALTFSSTIVIVKLLTTKHELKSLYGKISVGFLLVQDFAAMLILMTLVALGVESKSPNLLVTFGLLILRIVGLGLLLTLFSKFILPWLIRQTKHEREVLFLMVISWSLFFSSIAASSIFNFSIETGALLAGIALASAKESLQIETWTKSLRDFFLTVFFVLLGLNVDLSSIGSIIVPSLIYSVFVLVGNPLIVMVIMGLLGFNKRTGFFTSLTVAQISEFSLLLGAMGYSFGHLGKNELAILTLVGGITMTVSSYMIYYNHQLYQLLKPFLSIFELSGKKRGTYSKSMKDHTIIFGFNRLCREIYDEIEAGADNFLIVDHDPEIVRNLEEANLNVVYGDMNDTEMYDGLMIDKAKFIISTVPDKNSTLSLLSYLKSEKIDLPIVVTSDDDELTEIYYELGANYVLYPHLQASRNLDKIINTEIDKVREKLASMATNEKSTLNKRLSHILTA